jgi:hypothetical protein
MLVNRKLTSGYGLSLRNLIHGGVVYSGSTGLLLLFWVDKDRILKSGLVDHNCSRVLSLYQQIL